MIVDECPKCGKLTMPRIVPGDIANAARCQNPDCGLILERIMTTGAGGLTVAERDQVAGQGPEREQ